MRGPSSLNGGGLLFFCMAAMPEKIREQVMDVEYNVPEDFPYDTLKSRLLETYTLSDHKMQDVRAFGWPEVFPDADQHADLLSRWHGTDHYALIKKKTKFPHI
jgi:hypothetical protein